MFFCFFSFYAINFTMKFHTVLSLISWLLVLTSFASAKIWEGDESIIITDEPDDETSEQATATPVTEVPNANNCMSELGVEGQCIPIEQCYPYISNIELTNVLHGELAKMQLCGDNQNTTKYVCCTPTLYAVGKLPTWPNQQKPLTTPKPISILTTSTQAPGNNEGIPNKCGQSVVKLSPLIIGGRVTKPKEFPWQVAILASGNLLCGGSIISANYILTAAHCFHRYTKAKVGQLEVRLGVHKWRDGTQIRKVDRLVIHKGFSMSTLHSDVALLKVKEPITYNDGIQPVCLIADDSTVTASGSELGTISGWGKTCPCRDQSDCSNACSLSSELRTTDLTILTISQCQTKVAQASIPNSSGMICAKGKTTSGIVNDACQGDSGGPFVVYREKKATQVGIVSWGLGCGQGAGVYTRVTSFLAWIKKLSDYTG